MDKAGTGEGVVEHIAPGARDHQEGVPRAEVEGSPVHCRVFPAAVVDQRPRVEGVEDDLIESVAAGVHAFQWSLPQEYRAGT